MNQDFFLNIASMRFVTIKPPTTLIVANNMAINPRRVVVRVSCDPEERRAPTNVMPDIALDPDISGVCRAGGIFVIISNPTNIASTKIVMPEINMSMAS